MSDLIPVTAELLDRARRDREFRYQLLSEHLDELMVAMSKARNRLKKEQRYDPETARGLQEGARLALRLTDMLHHLTDRPPPRK